MFSINEVPQQQMMSNKIKIQRQVLSPQVPKQFINIFPPVFVYAAAVCRVKEVPRL